MSKKNCIFAGAMAALMWMNFSLPAFGQKVHVKPRPPVKRSVQTQPLELPPKSAKRTPANASDRLKLPAGAENENSKMRSRSGQTQVKVKEEKKAATIPEATPSAPKSQPTPTPTPVKKKSDTQEEP